MASKHIEYENQLVASLQPCSHAAARFDRCFQPLIFSSRMVSLAADLAAQAGVIGSCGPGVSQSCKSLCGARRRIAQSIYPEGFQGAECCVAYAAPRRRAIGEAEHHGALRSARRAEKLVRGASVSFIYSFLAARCEIPQLQAAMLAAWPALEVAEPVQELASWDDAYRWAGPRCGYLAGDSVAPSGRGKRTSSVDRFAGKLLGSTTRAVLRKSAAASSSRAANTRLPDSLSERTRDHPHL